MPFNIRSTASPLTSSYAQQAGGFADMAIRQKLAERERKLAAIREFAANQAAKRAQRQAERGGDWAGGAMTGAAGGAMAGAPFGPIGMGIGAAAGGITGGVSAHNAPAGGGADIGAMLRGVGPLSQATAAGFQSPKGGFTDAFNTSFRSSMGWDFMPPPSSGAGGPLGGLGKPPSSGGYSSYGGVNRPSSLGMVPMA